MEAVEDDEKGRGPVKPVRDLHGSVQVGLLGRSNYCQTMIRHLECRVLDSCLSGLHELCPCKIDCEKGVVRPIEVERNCKRVQEFE